MEGYLHDRLQIEYDQWPSSAILCSWDGKKKMQIPFFFFFFQRVFAALSQMKYYSLARSRHCVSIHLQQGLMDTGCRYYSSTLGSLDEGQISFMNVTVEMDISTHLSLLTDSANVKRAPPPLPKAFSTNVRNTSEQRCIWNHEGKPPCKCICNERRVQEVHYSLSATFISEYQMNMINVERGGGGGGSKVSRGYEMSDTVITPPKDELQKLECCETLV